MDIAICEDNVEDRRAIRDYLQLYLEENQYIGEIRSFSSGEAFLASYVPGLYGIIFLDIYMDELSGIETARIIRQTDDACALVFITSSLGHALDGFAVRASAYLVKPVSMESLTTALRQCRSVLQKNARYIQIRSMRNDIRLPLNQIHYIEVMDKTARFHTVYGEYQTRMPLHEIEGKLGGRPFYRCHKAFIVNLNQIVQIDNYDIVMKNGARVPIRTRGRDETRAALADHLSRQMFEV